MLTEWRHMFGRMVARNCHTITNDLAQSLCYTFIVQKWTKRLGTVLRALWLFETVLFSFPDHEKEVKAHG